MPDGPVGWVVGEQDIDEPVDGPTTRLRCTSSVARSKRRRARGTGTARPSWTTSNGPNTRNSIHAPRALAARTVDRNRGACRVHPVCIAAAGEPGHIGGQRRPPRTKEIPMPLVNVKLIEGVFDSAEQRKR